MSPLAQTPGDATGVVRLKPIPTLTTQSLTHYDRLAQTSWTVLDSDHALIDVNFGQLQLRLQLTHYSTAPR